MNWSIILFKAGQIVSLGFAIFLLIFAFEAFDPSLSSHDRIGLLMNHLVPPLIVISMYVLSKRFPIIGGILFIALGSFYVVWSEFRFNFFTYAAMAGPLILSGLFFLLSSFFRKKINDDYLESKQ